MGPGLRVRLVASVCVSLACLAGTGSADSRAASLRFVDATKDAGVVVRNVCGAEPGAKGWLDEAMGAGAAWLDYDGDGKLDLYVVNGSTHERAPGEGEPNRLFRGDGKGKFKDVTATSGLGDRGWGHGVTIGDVDNDGRPDVYVTNHGPNTLYRNRGDGTFENVTAKAGVGDARWSTSAAFFDMEGDGDLDLYVGNYMKSDPATVPRAGSPEALSVFCTYKGIPVFCGPLGQKPQQDVLYRNDGEWRFTDGDVDNDGDQDVYVANDSVTNSLWRNNGDGTFRDAGVISLAGLNADGRAQAGMGTDLGDFDGDGWLDIVVTNFSHDTNTLYRNLQGKFFADETSKTGLGVTQLALSWGCGFRDFDNDGDLDLFIANGHVYPQVDGYDMGTRFRQRNHLFVNEGGRFSEAGADAGPGLLIERSFRGAAFGDYDNDGDVDVFVTALNGEGLLLRNDTSGSGHWLELSVAGGRSNRDGVGTRVVVVSGGTRRVLERTSGGSYLSTSDPRLHVGLGAAQQVERVEVTWPDGTKTVVERPGVDRQLALAPPR
jgi:hypothetical protein